MLDAQSTLSAPSVARRFQVASHRLDRYSLPVRLELVYLGARLTKSDVVEGFCQKSARYICPVDGSHRASQGVIQTFQTHKFQQFQTTIRMVNKTTTEVGYIWAFSDLGRTANSRYGIRQAGQL